MRIVKLNQSNSRTVGSQAGQLAQTWPQSKSSINSESHCGVLWPLGLTSFTSHPWPLRFSALVMEVGFDHTEIELGHITQKE